LIKKTSFEDALKYNPQRINSIDSILRKNYGGGFVRPEENCRECKSDNDVQ
jgi:hypothetical protein